MEYKRAEFLKLVVDRYPLEKRAGLPSEHDVAEMLRKEGYIVEDADGRWIPTARGIYQHKTNIGLGTVGFD